MRNHTSAVRSAARRAVTGLQTGIVVTMASLPTMAAAQSTPTDDGIQGQLKSVGKKAYGTSGDPPSNLTEIIGTLINAALGLLGVVLLVIIMYGGFLWMTAGGNDEKVKKAKQMLTNGIIGLVIVSLAYAISIFVVDSIVGATTGTGTS